MVDFIQVHSASTCTHTNYTCHIIVKHNIDLATYTLSTDAHSAGTQKNMQTQNIAHCTYCTCTHSTGIYSSGMCTQYIVYLQHRYTCSYHLLTARLHIAHGYIQRMIAYHTTCVHVAYAYVHLNSTLIAHFHMIYTCGLRTYLYLKIQLFFITVTFNIQLRQIALHVQNTYIKHGILIFLQLY